MDPEDPADPYRRVLPFLAPLKLSIADHIALTAAYDQCASMAIQLHSPDDIDVRTAVLTQNLPRLGVSALTCMGGMVSYLNHPDSSVKREIREMLLAASAAGRYPDMLNPRGGRA